MSSSLRSSLFEASDHHLAIRVESCVFINVYLPTNYTNDESERLFALSCEKLGSCLENLKRLGLQCAIVGDFNFDLSEVGSKLSYED